jgi:hypothetical protein
MKLHPHIEPLEARIAPATFLVNGTNKTFADSAGMVVAGNTGAATDAGADAAGTSP